MVPVPAASSLCHSLVRLSCCAAVRGSVVKGQVAVIYIKI